MSKKPKLERFVTPMGVAQYPHLNKPDTKFNPDGEYKVNIEIDNPDAVNTLSSFLDEQMADSFAKAQEENKGKKIKQADAPYTLDENTGKLTVRFKLKAKVTPKNGDPFEQRVALFDAKGTPMVTAPNVGGGSKIKVSYEVMPFYTALIGAGISLRVRAVQIIDLVEYSAAGAGAYGFGQEDGYEADTTATKNEFTDATEESEKDF